MTDDPEVNDLIKDITTEARKTFNLGERIQNRGFREDKIVLYTDDQHAYAHSVVAAKILKERNAGDEDAAVALEEKLAELADLTNDSAITVELRAVPDIVLKGIKREARKQFVKKGPIPQEMEEDYLDSFNQRVVGSCITRVTDADGAIDETNYLDHNNVKLLQDYLPLSEWNKLWNKVQDLQFSDKIGLLATSDPDF